MWKSLSFSYEISKVRWKSFCDFHGTDISTAVHRLPEAPHAAVRYDELEGEAARSERGPDTLTFDMCSAMVEGQGMATPKTDLPQGTLDLLILRIVALGPLHGYGIAQRLQQISRDVLQVQQGSLYPALHRLEKRGLLASAWRPSETGRDAKFYRMTAKGKAQLKEEAANWARLTAAIQLILRTEEGGTL
jgi:PadR family transcriptional regulator PadR